MMDDELHNSHIVDAKIGNYVVGKDIDAIVCINLESRKDRREHFMNEFKNYPFRFYTAKLHEKPVIGCKESHINVIKWAKSMNLKNVLIFEDDVKIVKDLTTISDFPIDWQMLYLGGLCVDIKCWPEVYNKKPWIHGNVYCAHAYLTDYKIYDTILNFEMDATPIDELYVNKLHPKINTYISYEPLVVQRDDVSDLDGKHKWSNFKWPISGQLWSQP